MSSDFPGDHEPAQQNADPDGQVPPPDLGEGNTDESTLVEQLVGRVGVLHQQVLGLSGQVAEAEATANKTKQDLATVVADLAKNQDDPKGLRLQRFRFERAEHPEQAAAAQRELELWVPWLVDTYNLYDYVFPCWARHDGVAEELAGIYLAWLGAWGKDTRDNSVVLWHEELARFKTRLSDWRGGVNCMQRCALDERLQQQRNQSWRQQVGPQDQAYRLDRTRRIMPAPKPPKPATGAATKKPAASVAAPMTSYRATQAKRWEGGPDDVATVAGDPGSAGPAMSAAGSDN